MMVCIECWLKTLGALAAGIFGIGILLLVHELGHFVFARLSGTDVPSFSIGIGPKLWKKTWHGTEFIIGALPLMGYVEIAGQAEPGQGEQKHAHDRGAGSFASKSFMWKLCIMLGGILFNLLAAYGIFVALHITGMPKSVLIDPDTAPVVVGQVMPESAAARAGLQPGDKVVGLEQTENPGYSAYIKIMDAHKGQVVPLLIERAGTRFECPVTVSQEGKIGIRLGDSTERVAGTGILEGFWRAGATVATICVSTYTLIIQLFKKHSASNVSGPIMMIAQGGASARQGFANYLLLLAIISIGLALFNLIPLPITDGGNTIIFTLETIFRRDIPLGIKTGLYLGTWILVALLFLFISAHDLFLLFGEKVKAIIARFI